MTTKEQKGISGLANRVCTITIIVLMVTTIFGGATELFTSPEPAVDAKPDVPDVSPPEIEEIDETIGDVLENAEFKEYFAPEKEEITHDYSNPEKEYSEDSKLIPCGDSTDSKIRKNNEPPDTPSTKDAYTEGGCNLIGSPVKKRATPAYYETPEAESFAEALAGRTSVITETAIPVPPIIHIEPESPSPMALSILLVDDDRSPNNGGGYDINSVEEPSRYTFFQYSLNNLGCVYDLAVVPASASGPDLATLEGYNLVIWVLGYQFFSTLTATDQTNLGDYLDGGGKLWLDGPLFLYDIYGVFGSYTCNPGQFAHDYLHMEQGATHTIIPTPNPLVGATGGIEDGNSYATASYWTQFGSPENYATEVVPQADAQALYNSDDVYFPMCGLSWTNGHKVVYTGAEWAFIISQDDRDASMQEILNFLIPSYGCRITPDFSAQDTTPNSVVPYPLNIINTGIAEPLDLFDLTYASLPLGWTVEFFEEDGVTPLVDNNLDGNPDTGVMPSLSSKNIVAKVTVPPAALIGDTDTAIITARSWVDPLYFSQATLETTVPPYSVEWAPSLIDGYCRENNYWMYPVIVRNTAVFPDTFDLTSFTPMGWTYTFYEADGSTLLVDTGGTPDVDTGVVSPLTEKEIKIKVDVPLGNPPGTIDNAIITATSVGDPLEFSDLPMDISVLYEIPYFEGVEFGEDSYTHYPIVGGSDLWAPSGARSYEGAWSWYSGVENPGVADLALESPYIYLPRLNVSYAKLDFWHWYDFFDATGMTAPPIVDGAIVECWDAGSQSWTQITPDDGYDGTINPFWGNPLRGLEGFGLNSGGWQHEYFDILNYLNTGPITGTVVNETVYGPTVAGETGPIFLDHGGIVDLTLYIDLAGSEWIWLEEGPDFTLNAVTGEIDTTSIEPYEADWVFHAYYNYSAGNVLKFRWRVGTDVANTGTEMWYIDNIRVRLPMFGSVIKPEPQEKWGVAGTVVTYDFTVENIGNQTDDFTLEYQGIWPATIYDDTWTPRTGTGPMSTGEIISFHLNVSIPGTAVGALDDTLIWSNSTLDPLEYTNASILTKTPYETPYYWDATAWDDWTTSTGALWHLEGSRSNSPPTSCAFNDGVDYDTGVRSVGSLYSPWIDLPAGRSYAEISWWEWRETEDWGSPYDGSFVYISTDGKTWDMLYANYLSITTWTKRTYDISAYIGNIVKFRFFFDSRDTTNNAYEGWFVDDVRILSPEVLFTPPAQSAFADPGDTVTYSENIMNEGENTDSFDLTISTVLGWPATIYDTTWTPIVNTGPIDPGNSMDLYVNVTVPGAALTSDTEITTITATSTSTPTLFVDCPLTTFVKDDILVVDDDGAIVPDTGTYYTNALTALGYGYDLLEVATMGKPDLAGLQAHTITIWFCGENGGAWLGNDEPLTAIDRSNIATYLNGGGKMFWSSGGSSGAASLGSWKNWINSYFFGDLTSGGYTGAAGNVITGRAGNPIGDGLTFDLYTGVDGWVSPTGMGGLINRGNEGTLPSMTCFDSSFGLNSGFNGQSGDFRTVFFAWDYAGIDGAATRNTVMQRILDYIDPDVGVQLTPSADRLEFGPAGTDVTYDLNIKNMGKNPDSFDLTAAGAWTVTFYDTAWTPIINTGLLNPTESINIYINVSIPGAAAEGNSDTSVVTVTSTVDNTVSDSVTMITHVPYYPPYNYPATIVDGWTTSSTSPLCTWHLEGSRFNSTPTSWVYNDGVDCDLGEGVKHGGNLYSPWISLPAGSIRAEFSWWEWRETKNTVVDISRVYISTDGETWDKFYEDPFKVSEWTKQTYDISAYIGNVVKFRFFFYSQGWYDDYEGWYVDDIQVWCPEYGSEWWTPRQPAFGDPGDIKSYDMILQNIGRYTDTFAFTTTTTLGWPVTVYDDTWTVVADSGAMDSGTVKQFHANVTIPLAALTSDRETTIITATSVLDPAYTADETLTTFVRDPVLLVSDDFEKGIETFYMDALDNNSFGGFYSYDWLDTYTMGTPSVEGLQAHDIVIWHTVGVGIYPIMDERNPLDANERSVIDQYLDGGGLMYLSSAMPVAAVFNGYVPWGSQYFGMTATNWWPWPVGTSSLVYGKDGNPVGKGMTLNYHMGDGHPDCLGEGCSCAGGADGAFEVAFMNPSYGECVGTTLDTGTRRVSTTFDLADISGAANRDLLMCRILTFLLPPPYAITISPLDQSQCANHSGETLTYELNITNTGTISDIYDISVSSAPLGWTVTLYEADGVTPLADTGGTPGVPDTGVVAPGGYYNIVAEVQVDPLANPGDIDVATVQADSFSAPLLHVTATLDTKLRCLILLVDDDDSINNDGESTGYSAEDPDYRTPYADALTALGYPFDIYVVAPFGADGPDLDTLQLYPIVIWICGGSGRYGVLWPIPPDFSPLTYTDQNNLATYLDNGGKLWQNLESLDWYLSTSPGSFAYDYLKISNAYFGDNALPPNPVVGEPGTIFAGASYATASVWPFGKSCTGEVDILALPNSLGVFPSPTGTEPYCANTYEDGYQTCYFGFEFAFITNAADREDCAWRILNWFMPPVDVSIDPSPQNWYGTPTSYVWYNLTVKNKGFGGTDSFDMSYVSPLGWTYDFFESDMVTPLVDTNGNLVPDTGDIPTRPTIIEVVNETVYGPAVGGEMGPIWLDHGNIIDCSLYLDDAGDWWLMEEEFYTLNYTTGEIDITPVTPLDPGVIFYAYYNCTMGNNLKIAVRVTIPGTAVGGDLDTGTVTATSFNDALISADAALETLCYVPGQDYRAVYISNHPESDAAAAENDQLLYNSAIWAGNTGGNVKLTIVDSWGTNNPAAWQSWAAGHGDIDVVFVDSDVFTYGDLIMSQGDVLVISHAKGRVYSDTEISAIQRYTNESHGLIATGGSMDFGVPNNIKLLPLFGLAIGFQPWATSFTEYMVDEPLHPVMAGLPNPFSPGTALKSCTMMTLDRAVCLAHLDTDLTGMITAYDTTPPTFAGIQTCVDAEGAINLGWLPATSSTAITYNIYQALASGAQNFAAPTYTTTELNYQVMGLVPGVTYYYVVRAEDKYGNEDTNTVELSATPSTTRLLLQVQTPGFAGYQNLSLEPLEAALQTKMTDVPAAGNYLIGDVGWITEPSAEPYDLAGNWKFHMWAYITDPVITGTLFIRCWNYSAGPVAMLFETGPSELVDGHMLWHEFVWTYDVPVGTVTQAGERIFLELWIDATGGGMVAPVDDDTYVVSMSEILGTVDPGTFVNAQDGLDGDWATIREAGAPTIDDDTYVTSFSDILGTTTNFANAQSDADGGLFATLTEEYTGSPGGPEEYYADTVTDFNGVATPGNALGAPDDTYATLAAGNEFVQVTGSTWGLGSGTITKVEIGASWNSAGLVNDEALLRYRRGGSYGPTTYSDSTNYAVDNTYYMDITSDTSPWPWWAIGDIQPELIYNKVAGPDGGTINIDALWIRVTILPIPDNHEMTIEFVTSGITVGDAYTLEINYQTSGEVFGVYVWDGGTWNKRGADLTSGLMSAWIYTLLPAEVIANEVRVRYRGQSEAGDVVQDTLDIEYHRVNSQAAAVDYRCDIQFNTIGISLAETYTYTLEIYYQVSAEPYQLWIWNYSTGGFWEQITTLNSMAWVEYTYVIPPDQISAGEVLVRYIDATQIADAVEDTIDIEYHRVNSFAAGGIPAQIVLGYDFAAQPSSVVLPAMTPPPDLAGPVTTNAVATPNPTNGANLITLTANVSDIGLGDNSVIAAEYFVDVIGADGTGNGMTAEDGAFDSPEENVTQTIDISPWPDGVYTLYVHGQDAFGNWGAVESTVLYKTSTYQQLFMPGWILISIPYEPADTALTTVLSSIAGDYDYVQYYNASDPADPWKTYATFKPPALNDLTEIHGHMGFWIHLTAPTVLTVYGYEPTSTAIDLYAGWNLVGYPTRDDSSYDVTQLMADTGATSVEGFDASAPYRIKVLPGDYVLKRGEGYWVQVPFDTTWTVNW